MTTLRPPIHHSAATLLAPLVRGLMHRTPEILCLSVHEAAGGVLWSSGDFLLAEDHALIAEVVELSGAADRRARQPCCLWWESADIARARCAMAVIADGEFRGVLLAAFAGLTAGEQDREARGAALAPVLPVLGRAIRMLAPEMVAAGGTHPEVSPPAASQLGDDEGFAALSFGDADPEDTLARDLAVLEREESLVGLIDEALREDRFELHLQPIVSLREEHEPLIVEVLIRLPTSRGVLSSYEFLECADRNGRMPAIDRWVIRALLVWMQRNRERWAEANAVFAVNLSGRSVMRPDFRDYLTRCLDKSGLPLTALRFEISELDMGLAPQEFAALARALTERGCDIAVDHAGSGPGCFDFLREASADTLKIDGSLVRDAAEDRVARARIHGLVHLADALGMRTVAHHVDSTSRLHAVRELGVDYAQGYRLRMPEHIDSFDFIDCGIQMPEAHASA